MPRVHSGPLVGLAGQTALLVGLGASVGLAPLGWVAGAAYAAACCLLLEQGLRRRETLALGPANRVTLVRAVLVGGVTALAATSLAGGEESRTVLLTLAVVALALDAVDGRVARLTDSVSSLGARFDMEVDAFLILVLSLLVSGTVGPWVLVIGSARYAFLVAGWLMPWLQEPLRPRFWSKVVAAVQGVVLAVALSGLVPPSWSAAALLVALLLLSESFGRDVWWLRQRAVVTGQDRWRSRPPWLSDRMAGWLVSLASLVLVWVALTAPGHLGELSPRAFVRVPLEGVVLVTLVLFLPARVRPWLALAAGALLGALTVLKVLDLGFLSALGRPFNLLVDWTYLGPAVDLLGDSIGRRYAVLTAVSAAILLGAVLLLMPFAVLRLTRVAQRHRLVSLRVLAVLGLVWVVGASFDVHVEPGVPMASTSTANVAYGQVGQVRERIADERAFEQAATVDHVRDTPARAMLTDLRGMDVLLVFVESYGRVALEGGEVAPVVRPALVAGERRLRAAGYSARSGFLTSPTYGGLSWLAHGTLQTGLWLDTQPRYDRVVTSDRETLSSAFERAGWRTVAAVPANREDWTVGSSFYGFDQVYDAGDVGYAGPKFGYATMPDQFVLSAFARRELTAAHPPVMAEIDLVSGHAPWAPIPRMVPWDRVGNGEIFDAMHTTLESPADLWQDPERVPGAYARAVAYSWRALTSFVRTYSPGSRRDLVLVVLGDHQPASVVSGDGADHDVPVSVIARDPGVLAQAAAWGWQQGLRPTPDAPLWPMDEVRDRFLDAFSRGRLLAAD